MNIATADVARKDTEQEQIGHATAGARNYAAVKVNPAIQPPFSEESFQTVKNIRQNISLLDVQEIIKDKFIQMDSVGKAVALSLKSGQELILHGPPGYGKSDIVKYVLQELGLDAYTAFVDFGASTTEADLYGGMDVKTYKEKGELRFNTEQSWMQYPIAVFEEALDGSSPRVLHSLRSLLTSGIFTKNGVPELVKTEVVIIITNRDPNDFAEEDIASEAFVGRFPLRKKVIWQSHTAEDYTNLLIKKFPEVSPDSLGLFAEVLAHVSATTSPEGKNRIIAPREAIQTTQSILEMNPEYIPGCDTTMSGRPITFSMEDLTALEFYPQLFTDIASAQKVYQDRAETIEAETVKSVLTSAIAELKEIDLQLAANISGFTEHARAVGMLIDREFERLDTWSDNRRNDMNQFLTTQKSEFVSLFKLLMPENSAQMNR